MHFVCLDGATRKTKAQGKRDDSSHNLDGLEEIADGEDRAGILPTELTEVDVIKARNERWNIQETVYGRVAMSIAEDVNFFKTNVNVESFLPAKRHADRDEMEMIDVWNQELHNFGKRTEVLHNMNSSSVTISVETSTLEAAVEPNASFGLEEERNTMMPKSFEAQKTEIVNSLKSDQKRAFNIIDKHLGAHLKGRQPPQLMMMILGQCWPLC